MEFLHGLGWIVDPVKHPGFLGKLRPETEEGSRNIGLSIQIPYRSFPYYADAVNEIAFIQPILRQSASDSTSSIRSVESSDSGPDSGGGGVSGDPSISGGGGGTHHVPQCVPLWTAPTGSGVQESSVHADGDRSLKGGGNKGPFTAPSSASADSDTPRRRVSTPQDCAAVVVWLECYEDHLRFPLETLSKLLHKSCCKGSKDILPTIFVHKLGSGLYQIATRSSR